MMEQLLEVLKNEFIELKVCPQVGAGIFSMRYYLEGKWVDIMRPTPYQAIEERNAGQFASFNMIPYSNRIENAVLKFRGRVYNLQKNTPEGHAIHGDVRFRPWKVLHKSAERIAMGFDSRDFDDVSWPFPFYAEMEYALAGFQLTMQLMLKNAGTEEMPGGMGIHPYFMRKLTPEDNAVFLQMPAKGVYPGDTPIPTGPWTEIPQGLDFSHGRQLGFDHIDKCYRALHAPVIIKWPGSGVALTMKADEIFRHVILYSPKDNPEFFAVEPVTNCNNGFNMAEEGIDDTGTIYMKPGDIIRGSITIRLMR